MQWQLNSYRAKDGALEDFAREWHERMLPLRVARGFQVLGPWTNPMPLGVANTAEKK